MNKVDKVHAFKELHSLLIFYSENRDQPVDEDFDFFGSVEKLCKELDLDFDTFKEVFQFGKFTN